MGFWGLLLIFVASAVVSILLRPKIEDTSKPGDFRPVEPREGEPIPVAFGTVLLSPSITWFGDVEAKKVKKTESSLFGLVKDDIPLGYEYYAGMMLVLCWGPIDEILDIHIGEKRVARTAKYIGDGLAQEPEGGWPSPTTPTLPESYPETGMPTRVSINLPDLFGGKDEGGGIVGQIDVHWGSLVQGPNDYLGVWWGADIVPNYRYLSYVVLRRMNMGKSPSPQPWKFVVKRIPDVLGQSDYAMIEDVDGNETANAAEVVYELLVDSVWGLGKDPNGIDIASFQAVGQTLHDEDFGYCGTIYSRSEAWPVIQKILEHIDGVLYQDPTTGLIALKLIRDDYSVGDLVELDETNSTIDEYTRGSWAEVVNETQVQFTDVARRFTDGVAQAQNLAAITAMGGEVVTNTYSLKGLSTHEQAQLVAERVNRTTAIPLTRFRVRTNRIAYAFHPGMPFKLSSTEYGITDMVCRVVEVGYGSLIRGEIELSVIQDVWDVSSPAYASPDDLEDLDPCGPLALLVSGYDPSNDPAATYSVNGYTKLFEAPYWHNTSGGRAWIAQSRKGNQDAYWEVYRSLHGAPREKMANTQGFVAVGLLDAQLEMRAAMRDVSFTVQSAGDMESLTSTDYAGMVAGERLMMIGDEILSWTTIENLGDGQYRISGVWRGVLDTVPVLHPQSTPVFFYYNESGANSAFDITDPDDLDEYTSIQVWPVIVNLDGSSDDPDNVEMSYLLVGERASAPYPPGDIRLEGYGYEDWPTTTTGDVTLSWAHRSRTGQSELTAQDTGISETLEGTITVEVLIEGEAVREWTGLTGTSQVYTFAQRTTDDADTDKLVKFRITPIGTGSEEGTVRVTPSFTMESS